MLLLRGTAAAAATDNDVECIQNNFIFSVSSKGCFLFYLYFCSRTEKSLGK